MSKLNEEIIDVLQAARGYITGDNLGDDERQTQHDLNQLDRVLAYFEARRHVEECRRDEE